MADWNAIKTEYIQGDISYSKLKEKHGVSMRQLAEHGRSENWVEARAEYRNKVATKSIEKAVEIESNRLAKLMTATSKVVDKALQALEDDEQFNRYIISEGIGGGATVTEERIYKKTDTKALNDTVKIIKECAALMRDFYNIPTPAQAEAQRIAAERLELDKAKRAAEDNAEDAKLEIVGLPERYKV